MRERPSAAPGECVDCGNDAYIRLASSNGEVTMICARCFAERARTQPAAKTASPPGEQQPTIRH